MVYGIWYQTWYTPPHLQVLNSVWKIRVLILQYNDGCQCCICHGVGLICVALIFCILQLKIFKFELTLTKLFDTVGCCYQCIMLYDIIQRILLFCCLPSAYLWCQATMQSAGPACAADLLFDMVHRLTSTSRKTRHKAHTTCVL